MTSHPVKHVVLVGLPGVGKSTVGRGVADRLRRRFIDLDIIVERTIGKSIGRIFQEDGESFFRIAEAEASAAIARLGASVIAPGGGWVLNEAAKAHLLPYCRIIYLRVSPELAVRRMGRGIARRPLLYQAEQPEAAMRELFSARSAMYESSADLTIDTGGVSKAKVIARVVELVRATESDTSSTAGTND